MFKRKAEDKQDSLHQINIKRGITSHFARTLKILQQKHLQSDGEEQIYSNDYSNNLCNALEAVFLHGLKDSVTQKLTAYVGLSQSSDQASALNFWSVAAKFTHGDVVTQLKSLAQIATDVGLCRAWVRLALNDGLMESYLHSMVVDVKTLKYYYHTHAYLRDHEQPGILKNYLTGLMSLEFCLSCNSSVLNLWNNSTLQLAGLLDPHSAPPPMLREAGSPAPSATVVSAQGPPSASVVSSSDLAGRRKEREKKKVMEESIVARGGNASDRASSSGQGGAGRPGLSVFSSIQDVEEIRRIGAATSQISFTPSEGSTSSHISCPDPGQCHSGVGDNLVSRSPGGLSSTLSPSLFPRADVRRVSQQSSDSLGLLGQDMDLDGPREHERRRSDGVSDIVVTGRTRDTVVTGRTRDVQVESGTGGMVGATGRLPVDVPKSATARTATFSPVGSPVVLEDAASLEEIYSSPRRPRSRRVSEDEFNQLSSPPAQQRMLSPPSSLGGSVTAIAEDAREGLVGTPSSSTEDIYGQTEEIDGLDDDVDKGDSIQENIRQGNKEKEKDVPETVSDSEKKEEDESRLVDSQLRVKQQTDEFVSKGEVGREGQSQTSVPSSTHQPPSSSSSHHPSSTTSSSSHQTGVVRGYEEICAALPPLKLDAAEQEAILKKVLQEIDVQADLERAKRESLRKKKEMETQNAVCATGVGHREKDAGQGHADVAIATTNSRESRDGSKGGKEKSRDWTVPTSSEDMPAVSQYKSTVGGARSGSKEVQDLTGSDVKSSGQKEEKGEQSVAHRSKTGGGGGPPQAREVKVIQTQPSIPEEESTTFYTDIRTEESSGIYDVGTTHVEVGRDEQEVVSPGSEDGPISGQFGNSLSSMTGWSSEIESSNPGRKHSRIGVKGRAESFASMLRKYQTSSDQPVPTGTTMAEVLNSLTQASDSETDVAMSPQDEADGDEEEEFQRQDSCLEDFEVLESPVGSVPGHTDMDSSRMIFLFRVPREHGLSQQNFTCRGCTRPIGVIYGQPRMCEFDGGLYCFECHENNESCIPSAILYNWDFGKKKVCVENYKFLQELEEQPLYDIEGLNPKLYTHVSELYDIKILRQQLCYLKSYLFTCSQKVADSLRQKVWPREHLYDKKDLYAITDLLQVQSGSLLKLLKEVTRFGSNHVYDCPLCSQKGFVCEICRNPKVIYPFEVDTTVRCATCKSVFHKTCMTESLPCPKCQRWGKRNNNLARLDNGFADHPEDYGMSPPM
ncbi:uncharacterized protein LOC101848489 [Aplysia californica]|uniref:Uncharacterized protein LOC101848489 n=2 Tax=Aplysia californica TaxID=6500 RepID=A0ABM1AAB7_APLCA|nr:uncharacterized protein LOC101848489 [Aplysia californica]